MAAREGWIKKEDDEEEEEFDETNYTTQKDAVLFAIDVSASMLAQPPPSKSKKADRDSAVSAALQCAYQIMQQRIIAQPKDRMGILFFGTAQSKFRGGGNGDGDDDDDDNATDDGLVDGVAIGSGPVYPNCYLFMDLDVPAAEDVRALKSLVEDEEDGREGGSGVLVPASDTAAMSNVLFCANQIFTTNAPNFGSRRLFIITDNDDPHPGDRAARSAAAVRAKDLYDLGVVIELFPIAREGGSFDLAKFYDDIIYRDPTAEAAASDSVVAARSGDGLTLLASLVSQVHAKQTPKRAYFASLPLTVAPALDISVKGYLLLHRQKPARTCYVWADGERAQLVSSETVRVDADSTRTVEAAETKKAYKFGGEFVYFSPAELTALKSWPLSGHEGSEARTRGLRILGFKPRRLIPPWAAVRPAVFIYPSEEDYVGSTRVFSALWQKLRRAEKVAIAWYVPRANANPLLVAMMPGGRDGGAGRHGDDVSPHGLWLYPLPFVEDVRRFDENRPPVRCPAPLVDMAKPVVENLLLPKTAFDPAKYPNPALQWHYKILQALALEEEVPESGEDATLPKFKAIDKRVGGSLDELQQALAGEAAVLVAKRSIKREAGDGGADSRAKQPLAKRPRTAATASSEKTLPELRQLVQQGALAAQPVAVLKGILASKGLSATGRKAALVDRLEEWVEEQYGGGRRPVH